MPSNSSSNDSPSSAPGNAPSSSTFEPVLPHTAAIGLENHPGDDDAPATPAQIGARYDDMEAAIKESTDCTERDDDAPAPPAQIAAVYGEMEETIKRSLEQTQGEDAPLPPSQIAALADAERGDDETGGKKRAAPGTSAADDASPPTPADTSSPRELDEAIPTRSPSADPPASSPPLVDQGQIPSAVGSGGQQIPVRPPPQSMLSSPNDDRSTPSGPSIPMVEATRVEDQPEIPMVEATRVEDQPEIQVAEQTWLKRHQKRAQGLFVGLAVAAVVGVSLGSNSDSGGDETIGEDEEMIFAPPLREYSPTLVQVRSEGVLRCGVPNKHGFSKLNEVTGEREGMSVDLCKAVAAAVLGPEYEIELLEVTSTTRFPALAGRDIDLLLYGDTHTMERDFHEAGTGVGFRFSDPYFYDGLRFAGVPSAVECADSYNWLGDCSDLKICVMAGRSTHQDFLSQRFPPQILVPAESHDIYLQNFATGRCSAIAGEQNLIALPVVRNAGYEGQYRVGKQTLTKEPLAMVSRQDDPSWSDVVNWVLRTLIHAEITNVTQANARDGHLIRAVGNYGEIWERHMREVVEREGLNLLYKEDSNSGLHYSHPFGVINGGFRHEFDPSGTINKIIDRGNLVCGVLFGATEQSIDTDYCRALAASLFGSDSSLVDFVTLSDSDDLQERLDNGDIDVITGATLSVQSDSVPSKKPASGVSGLAFSQPYFYGEDCTSAKAMATSQYDPDWSSYVYWVITSTIWAEENGVTSKDFQAAKEVNIFGRRFEWMFRGPITGRGNYAEMYNRSMETLPPRAGRNLINHGSTPQLCPSLADSTDLVQQ